VLLISDILWLMLFSLSLFDIKLQALCACLFDPKKKATKEVAKKKKKKASRGGCQVSK